MERPKISAAEQEKRKPLPVEVLAGALQGCVHIERSALVRAIRIVVKK